jgi:16S rRNA (guanine(966)-N(2))-methyltransferase RsmD
MRVISGSYKNRRLFSPTDQSVRPVMDRVKEWVFDVISPQVTGAAVCDLFAGSGAFGIEACSRGARSVTFVDSARSSSKLIERNIAHIKMAETYAVHQQDVQKFVRMTRQSFDLVFCDPPYEFDHCQKLLSQFAENSFLNDGGLLIFEHHLFTKLTDFPNLTAIREKKFGKTMITLFEKKND